MELIDIHVHHHLDDPTMDQHVEQAAKHGVKAFLVHGVPNDIVPSLGDNHHVLNAMRKHPGVVFGSMHVDLRNDTKTTVETVRRYAGEGFSCVKMYPNLGFDPADPAHDDVWAEMEKHRLLCLPHCGYINIGSAPVTSMTATPYHFERAAREFPGIEFIMAHFGGAATYLETLVLCMRLPNFHADCTPGQGLWVWQKQLPGIEDMPFDHFFWGTDQEASAVEGSIKFWTETFDKMGISESNRELFFQGNAARLLGL